MQIGHNVEIGRGCVIVAQVGISGSTKIEDFVAIGGQTLALRVISRLVVVRRIGAQSGVMRDIPPGEEQIGTPANARRNNISGRLPTLNRLIKKKKKGLTVLVIS